MIRRIAQHGWKWTCAIVLMTVGIAGLVLPLIPGIVLIIAGGSLISPKFRQEIIHLLNSLKKQWNTFKNRRST